MGGKGVLRLTTKLGSAVMDRAVAASEFDVSLRAPKRPGYCADALEQRLLSVKHTSAQGTARLRELSLASRVAEGKGRAEFPGAYGRPRSVLGVSWRSWLAVTAMRRPGREGFVKRPARARTKVGLTSGSCARNATPPPTVTRCRSSPRYARRKCELTGAGHEEVRAEG